MTDGDILERILRKLDDELVGWCWTHSAPCTPHCPVIEGPHDIRLEKPLP